MTNLVIANVLSFITACFTMASSWTKNPQRTYWYQVGQCIVYATACYFFGVYAGIFMMLINGARNALVASERFNRNWCIFFCITSLALGLYVNDGSIPGYITIFVTVYYTLFSYLLTGPIAVKVNLAIDLAIWFVYDCLVIDIFSGIVDIISVVLAIVTIWRIVRGQRKQEESARRTVDL